MIYVCLQERIVLYITDPPYIKRIELQKVDGRGYPPSFLPAHFKKTVYVLSYYIATKLLSGTVHINLTQRIGQMDPQPVYLIA